jgi:transcriptional regulator with XRE-family HTH domain
MRKTLHSPDYARLLALLKQARKDSGIVQQELADRLGKPQSFVAKVERGERRIDVIEFIAIAKAIGRDRCGCGNSISSNTNRRSLAALTVAHKSGACQLRVDIRHIAQRY